jgi:uncharacterized repeat protein (TIGR02543 family)
LFIDNGVNAYIHGHDHIYAYEELDGIAYLEVPKPDDAGYAWEPYGYGYTEDLYPNATAILTNSGHIRVTVSPTEARFDYVRAYLPGDGVNRQVAHSFTIVPSVPPTYNLTISLDPIGGGIIAPSVGTHSYAAGTVVNITSTPASGYVFSGWSGDLGGSTNPTSITMDSNKVVTATFLAVITRTLSSGWNLLALPLQPQSALTAETLLDDIASQGGTCSEIDRWLNGGWDFHVKDQPENDFALALGQAYFVRCAGADFPWQARGTPLSSGVGVNLAIGWNLLSVPFPTGLFAESLLDDIDSQGGACSEIDRWLNGGWDFHVHGQSENDFAIASNDGYFVRCSTDITYTPIP